MSAPSRPDHIANLGLNGARVTRGFREALFDAANREGVSVNEFVIVSAAEKLARRGFEFPGVFRRGDLSGESRAA